MLNPNSYCAYALKQPIEDVHRKYHDTQYGFPIYDDNELFGRLILEINQAGLSWTTILNKAENFRKAYSNFEIIKIARYGEKDIQRLLEDKGIIRNKLKVGAAIYNAQKILEIQDKYGSFKEWLDEKYSFSKEEWVTLFKNNFKFTGGEITGEFLMSSGYLFGAHDENCKIHKEICKMNPAWMKNV